MTPKLVADLCEPVLLFTYPDCPPVQQLTQGSCRGVNLQSLSQMSCGFLGKVCRGTCNSAEHRAGYF